MARLRWNDEALYVAARSLGEQSLMADCSLFTLDLRVRGRVSTGAGAGVGTRLNQAGGTAPSQSIPHVHFHIAGSVPGGGTDPDTSINVDGVIGGIHARDTRIVVEKRLGAGTTISTSTHKQKIGGTYTLTRVRYPASQLVVLYVTSLGRTPRVFGVFTTSPRYHTADGLRVGSTLAQAQHEPGIRCYDQESYFACQGGLGYEKPITSFTVRNGRVARLFMAAVAD